LGIVAVQTDFMGNTGRASCLLRGLREIFNENNAVSVSGGGAGDAVESLQCASVARRMTQPDSGGACYREKS
jgi:hypothetical protein